MIWSAASLNVFSGSFDTINQKNHLRTLRCLDVCLGRNQVQSSTLCSPARGDLLPNRAFTRIDALLEKAPLHGVSRQVERLVEVLARDLGSSAVKFELAERRMIERIGGKAIAVGDSMNLFEAAFGAFMLGDSDCPVECNDRGRAYRYQGVVKRNDFSPVSLLRATGHRVNRRDRGLHVIFGQLGTRCREIEEPLPFSHELWIPTGSILIEERAQVARQVDSGRQSRRVETHERGKSVGCRRRGQGVFKKQHRKPQGLMAELGTYGGLGRCAVIALVKK